ncbi:MAG: ABC transporter substrate-binding protein [Anaerolineae bacterium]
MEAAITRRQAFRYLGLATAGTLLAACSPAAPEPTKGSEPAATTATEPTAQPAAPAPQGVTKIVMWTYPDDDIFFNACIPDFNAQYPEISVEVIKLDASDLDQKLTAAFAGGTGAPDLVDLEQSWIGKYAAQGGFVDLAADPFNVRQYEKDFPKFAWDAGYSADKSKYYFVYYSTAPAVIHYRRSLFEGAGLPSEPEEVRKLICPDWESYESVGETISKPEGPWMIDNAAEIFWNNRNQHAPNYLNDDGSLNIDNEANLQGLKLAKLARDNGIDAKLSSWTPEWENSFKQTQVASYLSGDWLQGLIKVYGGEGTKGDWGMLPLPGKGGASNGGSTLSIPEQSQAKEAAWKYLSYFSFSVKPQVQMFVLTTCFPGYIPAWDDPAMQEPVEWYGGQKARLISIEVAKQFSHRTYSRYDWQLNDIVGVEVANVLDKGKDPAQALADAQETAKIQLEL